MKIYRKLCFSKCLCLLRKMSFKVDTCLYIFFLFILKRGTLQHPVPLVFLRILRLPRINWSCIILWFIFQATHYISTSLNIMKINKMSFKNYFHFVLFYRVLIDCFLTDGQKSCPVLIEITRCTLANAVTTRMGKVM